MYETKVKVQGRISEIYNFLKKDNQIFGVFLKGSQNYMGDFILKDSDVDTVAVFMPTEKEFITMSKKKTKVISLPNNEKIELIEIREFFNRLKKPNIVTIEPLFTDYFKINEQYKEEFNKIIDIREIICNSNKGQIVLSTRGFLSFYEKNLSASEKSEKPTVSRKRKKALANIFRLNTSIKKIIEGADFKDALECAAKEMYKIRTSNTTYLEDLNYGLELTHEAFDLSSEHEFKNKNVKINEEIDEILISLARKILNLNN